MVEPLSATAGAVELAIAVRKGFSAVQALRPEYGRFWRTFEKALKPKARDLPWAEVAALQLNPEFIRDVCGLIRGDYRAQHAMSVRFTRLATPPEGSRYSPEEVVGELERAAEASAVRAAKSDRAVIEQRTSLLAGQQEDDHAKLMEEFRLLRREVERLAATVADLGGQVDRLEQAPAEGSLRALRVAEGSAAERHLAQVLTNDPEIVSFIPQPTWGIAWDRRTYRPDFIAQDRNGTHWLMEIKSRRQVNSKTMRDQLSAFDAYVKHAATRLGERWQVILVAADDVHPDSSWSDVKRRATDPS
jgi:hypothetical protein